MKYQTILKSTIILMAGVLTFPPTAGAQSTTETHSITVPFILEDGPRAPEHYTAALTPKYGPCTLTLDNVHLRKSGNFGTVGFKARTSCSVPVTSIHLKSDLRYKYYTFWNLAIGGVTDSAYNTRFHIQKNLEFSCNGRVNTVFKGTTLGTIVYNGHKYYARAYSKTSSLNCKV